MLGFEMLLKQHLQYGAYNFAFKLQRLGLKSQRICPIRSRRLEVILSFDEDEAYCRNYLI
jgi:hypothetical protein